MAQAPVTDALTDDLPTVDAKPRTLRQACKLSLDELLRRTGVSKSTLSRVEHNLASPTVAVLWRLTTTLGAGLAGFLSPRGAADAAPVVAVIPAHSIPVIKSPDNKCELRILSPVDLATCFEWYELAIQPGDVLASEPHELGSKEHIFVLSSTVTIQSDPSEKRV